MENNKENFFEIYKLISDSVNPVNRVKNDKEMDEPYKDEYTTRQQRLRDRKVTELLDAYVDGYKDKIKMNKKYKGIIFYGCCGILVAFSLALVAAVVLTVIFHKNISVADVCQLISICITFITLIIGILTIIVKYVFPEKEEEYITKIVQLIQKNDLANKKENIKAHVGSVNNENEVGISEEIDDI